MKGLLERAFDITLEVILWVVLGAVFGVAAYFFGLAIQMHRLVAFGVGVIAVLAGYFVGIVYMPIQIDKETVKFCMRRTQSQYSNVWPRVIIMSVAALVVGWVLDLSMVRAFILGFGSAALLTIILFINVCMGDRRRIFVRRDYAEMY